MDRNYRKGDTVFIDHPDHKGIMYEVTEVRRTRMSVKPLGNPTARGYNVKMDMVTSTKEMPPASHTTEVPLAEHFSLGTPVRITHKDYDSTVVYIVIKNNAKTISVAKLGGDNDRFIRVTSDLLERIPFPTV